MNIESSIQAVKVKLMDSLAISNMDHAPEIENEIEAFLAQSKIKLDKWIALYHNQAITSHELEWLVKSQKEMLHLRTLQQIGISKIRLNTIKNEIISTILKAVTMVL